LDKIGKNTEEKQFEMHYRIKGRLTKFHSGQHKNKMNTFWARAKNRREEMAYTGVIVDSMMEGVEGNTILIDEGKLSTSERKGIRRVGKKLELVIGYLTAVYIRTFFLKNGNSQLNIK
jgi:hypothetical protein